MNHLSKAAYTFPMRTLISLSVDELFLPKYVDQFVFILQHFN